MADGGPKSESLLTYSNQSTTASIGFEKNERNFCIFEYALEVFAGLAQVQGKA